MWPSLICAVACAVSAGMAGRAAARESGVDEASWMVLAIAFFAAFVSFTA